MKSNLTVIILTLNENMHIERCIKSILSFTDNVLVIDSLSNDDTVAICEKMGVDIFSNPWPGNHAKQFQWALEHCKIETEWVMKLDADEVVMPELASEIKSKLSCIPSDINGIFIKRRVHFFGKWIRHGGYYPTWLMRIWRFKFGIMEQRWMDEHIKLFSGGTIGFENDIIDDNKNNLTWWTQKHNDYATREAADILNTVFQFKKYDEVIPKINGTQEQRKRWLKIKYSSLPLFLRPFLYFIYRYFLRFGFLDGKKGLIWHFLQGFWYRFLVDAKIFEIYASAGKDKVSIRKFLKDQYGIKF